MTELNTITNEVVNSARDLFKDQLWRIMLYGSYARGNFNEESDVDIMILLDCDESDIRKFRKQTSRMASRIGLDNDVEVSLLVRDRDSFEQRKNILPFYRNVNDEGVILYG